MALGGCHRYLKARVIQSVSPISHPLVTYFSVARSCRVWECPEAAQGWTREPQETPRHL